LSCLGRINCPCFIRHSILVHRQWIRAMQVNLCLFNCHEQWSSDVRLDTTYDYQGSVTVRPGWWPLYYQDSVWSMKLEDYYSFIWLVQNMEEKKLNAFMSVLIFKIQIFQNVFVFVSTNFVRRWSVWPHMPIYQLVFRNQNNLALIPLKFWLILRNKLLFCFLFIFYNHDNNVKLFKGINLAINVSHTVEMLIIYDSSVYIK